VEDAGICYGHLVNLLAILYIYGTLVYFVVIWYIFKTKIPFCVNFGGSCDGRCLGYIWPIIIFYSIFVVIWYIFSLLGLLYQEKSGNPGRNRFFKTGFLCKKFPNCTSGTKKARPFYIRITKIFLLQETT
jgi:hypothetical protein